jgi:hypothetical protein
MIRGTQTVRRPSASAWAVARATVAGLVAKGGRGRPADMRPTTKPGRTTSTNPGLSHEVSDVARQRIQARLCGPVQRIAGADAHAVLGGQNDRRSCPLVAQAASRGD